MSVIELSDESSSLDAAILRARPITTHFANLVCATDGVLFG